MTGVALRVKTVVRVQPHYVEDVIDHKAVQATMRIPTDRELVGRTCS